MSKITDIDFLLQTPGGNTESLNPELLTGPEIVTTHVPLAADGAVARTLLTVVPSKPGGSWKFQIHSQVGDFLKLTDEVHWAQFARVCRSTQTFRTAMRNFQPSGGFGAWKKSSLKNRIPAIRNHLFSSGYWPALSGSVLAVGHAHETASHQLCEEEGYTCSGRHYLDDSEMRKVNAVWCTTFYTQWTPATETHHGFMTIRAETALSDQADCNPLNDESRRLLQFAVDRFGDKIASAVDRKERESKPKTRRQWSDEKLYEEACQMAAFHHNSDPIMRRHYLAYMPFPSAGESKGSQTWCPKLPTISAYTDPMIHSSDDAAPADPSSLLDIPAATSGNPSRNRRPRTLSEPSSGGSRRRDRW